MASSFMGLYVQREALVSAQKSLDITGSNITNVNTEGYSRQRLDVCSVANSGYNLMYTTKTSLAGQGVSQVGVTQLRDSMLDKKVRTYTTVGGALGQKLDTISDVETALDNIEADDSGFATTLAKFKESLQSFSSDNADRTEIADNTIESAKSLTAQINYLNTRLNDVSDQVLGDTKSAVTSINTILANMGDLNKQISDSYVSMGYITGNNVNYSVDNDYGPLELKDKMNDLIDKLSKYGDTEVNEESNGSFTITFAGKLAVHNDTYAQIAMTEESPDPLNMAFKMTAQGTYDADKDVYSGLKKTSEWNKIIAVSGDTQAYTRASTDTVGISDVNSLKGGSLRGYLDVYNGDGVFADATTGNSYKGIEFYRDMLNSLATTMTNQFNKVFSSFTKTDTAGNTTAFTVFDCGTDFHSAAENMRVADSWISDPTLISKPENFGGTAKQYDELNNTYINKMLGVINAKFSFGNGTATESSDMNFEEYVGHISNSLGAQVESENRLNDTNNIMLTSVTNARSEIMDVSIDEEGMNMLNYQKWYNAIARMVTTLDESLDKLINGTGKVGL